MHFVIVITKEKSNEWDTKDIGTVIDETITNKYH
jgi:hypothetical protein